MELIGTRADCNFPSVIDPRNGCNLIILKDTFYLKCAFLSNFSDFSCIKRCVHYYYRYPTPKLDSEELLRRRNTWKPNLPPPNYKRKKCPHFGQENVTATYCSQYHEVLWRELDKKGIVYFPRAGTELGIVRGSTYLSSDGDIDVFVDMPQEKLFKELVGVLSPLPEQSGDFKDVFPKSTGRYQSVRPSICYFMTSWRTARPLSSNVRHTNRHASVC